MTISTTDNREWQVVPYSEEHKEEWDGLVRRSKNGTFLLLRDYMDYHANRFTDSSLLLFCNRRLLALLPGNICSPIFNIFALLPGNIPVDSYYSHEGLTYGGMIFSPLITMKQVEGAFIAVVNYLAKTWNINTFFYRAIPHIYHRYPAEEDLYVLNRLGAILIERKASSAIPLDHPLPSRTLRRRQLKRAQNCALTIVEDEDFAAFWVLLQANLQARYVVPPVHSLEEIMRLHRSFPKQITLFRVCDGQETIGGCVVYETDEVAHVQYIAASAQGKKCGALDLLFHHLITSRYQHKRYFDFGISTTDGGYKLNEGLIFQKEGFGARAIMYDVYELSIPKALEAYYPEDAPNPMPPVHGSSMPTERINLIR